MPPTPQTHIEIERNRTSPKMDGDRIVISGMSGLYPRSHNIKELADILYNKENPVTADDVRWKYNHPEVAQLVGNIPELDRFDAQFFKVHHRLGHAMEPMSRKILEQAHNAIYDAGINVEQMSGKKVGVFIGSCFSEAEKISNYDGSIKGGYGVAGSSKAMFANRISYWLDAKGPSITIDESCCSSAAALEQAYQYMRRGDCDAAIVGGCSLCMHPQSSVHYDRVIKQAMDGKHKSFDEHADGCVKSEAVNVLFLQKSKDALRVYAELVHAKTEYIGLESENTGPRFGFFRSTNKMINFLKKFYEDASMPPQAVEYVEAFGSGLPDADKVELEALDAVICKGKDDTLKVGSVASNIGYVEAASGIAGVTKVLLGYHTGQVAANLHCEHPRQDVEALREGRMRIVTDHQKIGRSYVAVNGLSLSGVNSHILLHGHYKPKDLSRYKSNIPYLVPLSGRLDSAVAKMIEDLKSRPIDPEEIALLHNIHQINSSEHLGRGFVILDKDAEHKTVSLAESVEYFNEPNRPLWFVYSGMGSQWTSMGAQLMRIPIFAAAIEKCRQALEPKGVDIVNILTTDDDKIFDNILHSFVGIAAVQIGLTDVLRELGLVPDGIIGHSVGELGCAYADGCFTAEEMILAAYSRGDISLKTPFIRGSMAAVGLGYAKMSKMIPPEIEVACHNGPESCTISGPSDIVNQFVKELTTKGIFAKEVPCSNIAYHSRYIADAGPALLKYLKKTIKNPKQRSSRWVSTSVPKSRWHEDLAQYASAEYLTNNLLSPVLFEETLHEIPPNAVLVEIAPHGLLQAILKRSLPSDCKNITLTRRNHPDNVALLLESLGKLYMAGYSFKAQALYPKVEMPVSTGTPFLSHHCAWLHDEKWLTPVYETAFRSQATSCNWIISLHDRESQYLDGYVFRNKNLYPFAATLVAVWDTFAMIMGVPKKSLPVEFRDINLHVQPALHDQTQLRLRVQLERGSGNFEVLDGNILVATGCIAISKLHKFTKSILSEDNRNDNVYYDANGVYDLLEERQYSYSGDFRCLERVNESLTKADLVWNDNWVTCIDGLLQLNALRQAHDTIPKPKQIRKLCIDVKQHLNHVYDVKGEKALLEVEINETCRMTRCAGILIEDIRYHNVLPITENRIDLHALQFVQNGDTNLNIASSLQVFLQMISENIDKNEIKIVGLTNEASEGTVFEKIRKLGSNLLGINIQYEEIKIESNVNNTLVLNEADAVIVSNLSADDNVCRLLHNTLRPNIFVITEEDQIEDTRERPSSLFKIVSTLSRNKNSRSKLQLVVWRPSQPAPIGIVMNVQETSDYYLLESARSNLPTDRRMLIFSTYPPPKGLKDLVKAWRKEAERNLIQLILLGDESNHILLEDLPEINLVFNVVDHCRWGGEYYLPVQNKIESNNAMLKLSRVGAVNSLYWTEAPELKKDDLVVNVHYAGVSSTDVKKANGTIPFEKEADNCFGMDFSGTTTSGERVMGIVAGGAASRQVRAQPALLWPVPAHWTLEEAATVPLAYIQAFYCLNEVLPESRILIHGGCGAIGQAAIAIALYMKCQVFTTVSDISKKQFLLKLFPELQEKHIASSRDISFLDMVLIETNGAGCHCVITNTSEDLKDASCRCVGSFGHIIDLSQLQSQENYDYGMYHMTRGRSYRAVDLMSIFKDENKNEIKKLQLLLSEGIARGFVRPLSRVTYSAQDAPRAFQLLAASRHRGRVLLHLTPNMLCAPNNRISCDPDLCQLVLYNEEKFGLQLAQRLVDRGARKLHIHNKTNSSKLQFKIRSWQKKGVKVDVSDGNLNVTNVENVLKKAKELGVLQGIYFVISADENINEDLLKTLDSSSRKLCPNLRYFAIINCGVAMMGHATCISRMRSKLPATILSLAELYSENNTAYRDGLDAVEYALGGPGGALRAQAIHEDRPTILQQITALADITITKDTPHTATLEELGLKDDKVNSILAYLRGVYNMSLKQKDVPLLTLETILQSQHSEVSFEDVKGLGTFFSNTASDELKATSEMVHLPTKTGCQLRDEEFDASQSYLCIVPGMEGHYEKFERLCQRLKLSAFVLQPGLDYPHETVQDTAKRFVEMLLKKTALDEDFYLLGYESGVLVALEMARILEEQGRTGTVYCVGFAPDELKTVIEEHLSEYQTEEQLQDTLVLHMFKLMGGQDAAALQEALTNAASWSEKVDKCVRALRGYTTHSAQYISMYIQAALGRIEQARRYSAAAHALRSRLVLLRAATSHAAAAAAALQQHSRQPVVMRQLALPLAHAAQDARCAAIINDNLHPEILTAFENKNICDAYRTGSSNFMAHMD